MNLLGNIIWLVFGGLAIAVEYFIGGLVLCLTIIGIPFGLQAFKMGLLALFPFGQQTVVTEQGSGCLSTLMNILSGLYAPDAGEIRMDGHPVSIRSPLQTANGSASPESVYIRMQNFHSSLLHAARR